MESYEPSESMPGPRNEHGGSPSGGILSAGDFTRRFQESSRLLWTVAAGVCGEASEAEDVLQEAALMAWDKIEDFQPGTNFAAWVGKFVRFVALNHVRKRGRRRTTATDPALLVDHADEPAAHNGTGRPAGAPVDGLGRLRDDQTAFDDRVLAGLRELAEIPRACLLLRTVLELGYREISGLLGIPEGTAMSHVHRSRLQMRERLATGPASIEAEVS